MATVVYTVLFLENSEYARKLWDAGADIDDITFHKKERKKY